MRGSARHASVVWEHNPHVGDATATEMGAAGELNVGQLARRRWPGACLLVDDIRFSGWTLAMLAGQLRRRGAPAVYPLALTSAF